ncbi:dihydroxyacetone kinase subunit DhaL [Vallicoccus soli]|uniref:Dihydroxyacetone kinase subunit L n=1 Tax=Vallicoccus soli TaxID=2339232 RepID=A0A3A3YZ27_9ACTN|nr:dihydroxyacetone kinase subunit DhaL [Vallicoccus soli]RJK95524.1 dihydroxyacetone kinase subunit L [Vallicoccus soli]
MSGGLDAARAGAWVRRLAELVQERKDELTDLDRPIGDSDHGVNLHRGMTAAVAALDAGDPATPGAVLTAVGSALVSKVGGASGPLYGTALRRAGKALGDAGEAGTPELARALRAALEGVVKLGGAQPGDATLVDALAPAVEALEAAAGRGDDPAAAARAAAGAAEEGALATTPMVARKGRASYLGERSAGHQDPGATSTALLVRALADALEGA